MTTWPRSRKRQPRTLSRAEEWSLELRRLRHRWRLVRRNWFGRQAPHTPLFLLATYRSGSNLLLDYLNSLPGVQCYSEVLSHRLPIGPRQPELPPKQALRHIQRSLASLRPPIRGCKLMLSQLAACRLSLDDLRMAFPAARYLVLYRESLAEQLVSVRVGQSTNQWLARAGQPRKQARVRIEPVELRWFCKELRRLYSDVLECDWLPSCGALVSYEELCTEPEEVFRERICPLLEIPYHAPQTDLQKQGSAALRDRVENFADIEPLLAQADCRQRYAWPEAGKSPLAA